jgi:hypothetical protein
VPVEAHQQPCPSVPSSEAAFLAAMPAAPAPTYAAVHPHHMPAAPAPTYAAVHPHHMCAAFSSRLSWVTRCAPAMRAPAPTRLHVQLRPSRLAGGRVLEYWWPVHR